MTKSNDPIHLTLGTAALAINKYLQKKSSPLLQQFQHDINEIEKINTRAVPRETSPISQQALAQKALDLHAATLLQINQKVIELKKKSDAEIKKQHSAELKELLQLVSDCAEGVLKNHEERDVTTEKLVTKTETKTTSPLPTFFVTLERTHKTETTKITLPESEKRMAKNMLGDYCHQLGGNFYPTAQGLDALYGKLKQHNQWKDVAGVCYGLTKKWADEVAEYGYFKSLKGIDTKTLASQETYLPPVFSFKEDDFSLYYCSAIDKIIHFISPNNNYYIYINSSSGAHALGIRKLTNNSFELYDPNLGLFIFSNEKNFKIWLEILLGQHYSDLSGNIRLLKISSAKNARTSIENITSNPSVTVLEKYLENTLIKAWQHLETKYLSSKQDSFTILKNIETVFSHELNPLLRYAPIAPTAFSQCPDLTLKRTLHDLQTTATFLSQKLDKKECEKILQEQIKTENTELKNNVNAKINEEILRLKKTFYGDNSQRIKALTKLKANIDNANEPYTLATVISLWRDEKTDGVSNEDLLYTRRTLIRSRHGPTATANFIAELEKNYEISFYRLNLLRSILINKLIKLFSLTKSIPNYLSNPFPTLIERINHTFRDRTITPIKIISCIKKWSGDSKDDEENPYELIDLLRSLGSLDPNNPSALKNAVQAIDIYNHELSHKIYQAPPRASPTL